jgi:DNA-directed RNA polymerase specialized sigma24 family protein
MYARMLKVCRRRRCPREIAKELVQEAYVRFLEYQRITRIRNGPALLRRIVINLTINYYNREGRRDVALLDVAPLDREGVLVDLHQAPNVCSLESRSLPMWRPCWRLRASGCVRCSWHSD